MYNLTDFSENELRYLSRMMDVAITNHQDSIDRISSFDDSVTKDRMIHRQGNKLAMCREMNVRFLTALQIVKDRETTNAN